MHILLFKKHSTGENIRQQFQCFFLFFTLHTIQPSSMGITFCNVTSRKHFWVLQFFQDSGFQTGDHCAARKLSPSQPLLTVLPHCCYCFWHPISSQECFRQAHLFLPIVPAGFVRGVSGRCDCPEHPCDDIGCHEQQQHSGTVRAPLTEDGYLQMLHLACRPGFREPYFRAGINSN